MHVIHDTREPTKGFNKRVDWMQALVELYGADVLSNENGSSTELGQVDSEDIAAKYMALPSQYFSLQNKACKCSYFEWKGVKYYFVVMRDYGNGGLICRIANIVVFDDELEALQFKLKV